MEEYSEVKSDLRKVSGGLGKEAYHAEKERRKSVPFSWPNPSPPARGRIHLFLLKRKMGFKGKYQVAEAPARSFAELESTGTGVRWGGAVGG